MFLMFQVWEKLGKKLSKLRQLHLAPKESYRYLESAEV